MKGGWVYIMSNGPHGTLYTGVTSDLPRRVHQHGTGDGSDFCRRYKLTHLVYAEPYDLIEDAILGEKRIKGWKRQWKLRLIRAQNPDWRDLFDDLACL